MEQTCAAGQCCVMKYFVAEGVSIFKIHELLIAVIKKSISVNGLFVYGKLISLLFMMLELVHHQLSQ
jgi:hypothetical protein